MMIGIDLGTTNSAIAYINEMGNPEIIPNAEGARMTPSVILFEKDNIVVGQIAKQNAVDDPLNVAQFIKRQMGNKDFIFTTGFGKEYTAEELSAIILKKVKQDAETYLGKPIHQAVVTVPAYFDDAKRLATKDAGKLIGLDIVKIINEPTAAALAFASENKFTEKTVLVYDLGGGTFDATLLDLSENKVDIRATYGDRNLGGFDFDNTIIEYIIEHFETKYGLDLYEDDEVMQMLREKSEDVKKQLSVKNTASITVSYQGQKDKIEIQRSQFNQMIEPLVARTLSIMDTVVEDAGYKWAQVDVILLVGGSSRIPLVETMIANHTHIIPSKNINPDEAIALGAALQNLSLDFHENHTGAQHKKSMIISDVSSHSIGVSVFENNVHFNQILLKRNSKLPAAVEREFYILSDAQDYVAVKITEGEDTDLAYVRIIGEAEIELPKDVKKGDGIKLNTTLDENQIIHVFAFLSKGHQYLGELHIERTSNLTHAQITKMAKEMSSTLIE